MDPAREPPAAVLPEQRAESGLGLVVGVVIALGGGALLVAGLGPRGGGGVACLATFIVGFGLLLVAMGVGDLRARRRYGASTLELAAVPATFGSAVDGRVRVPTGLPADLAAKVVLRCLKVSQVRRAGTRGTTTEPLWSTSVDATTVADGASAFVPVTVPMPREGAATTAAGVWPAVVWELSVAVKPPTGVSLYVRFRVPVG